MDVISNLSGLSKQLLNNFQIENSCDRKQLKTEVKNEDSYKKIVRQEKQRIMLKLRSKTKIQKLKLNPHKQILPNLQLPFESDNVNHFSGDKENFSVTLKVKGTLMQI